METLKEKIADIIQRDVKELTGYDVLVSSVADDVVAAICEEEGHKSTTTHTEQLGGGRFRDHFKCLRCGDVKIGPKGQKYPDGTVGYE
jgi:hypothetical protein